MNHLESSILRQWVVKQLYNGDPAPFEKALTESITRLMAQPDLLKKYGTAGRIRAQKLFGWDAVAALTVDLYRRVIA